MKKAVYPGSFDPLTNGHLEILKRALKAFDEVILLLAVNPEKTSNFSVQERLEMMKESTAGMAGVEVDYTDGLTVEYCVKHGANHIVRGLRAVTDFEYEFSLAAANEFIDPSIDMVFFMARKEESFISSSSVVSMAHSGVDVSALVPKAVLPYLKKKGL